LDYFIILNNTKVLFLQKRKKENRDTLVVSPNMSLLVTTDRLVTGRLIIVSLSMDKNKGKKMKTMEKMKSEN
jgi:hypothetical protein